MSFTVHPFLMTRGSKDPSELGLPRSLSYINNLYQNARLAEDFGGQGQRFGRPRQLARTESSSSQSCDPELRPIMRRRTKSLPSSPEKKITAKCRPRCHKVRFADSLGLELAEVKEFNAKDNPSIPLHVLSRLSINSDLCCGQDFEVSLQYLVPDFQPPADGADFSERLRQQRVCLEHVTGSEELGVSGTIRVLNLAFEKRVTVRYTFTNWRTHYDVSTVWEKSEEGSDVFAFTISLPSFLSQICSAVQFAIKYEVAGREFWDSNGGKNYTLTSRSHTFKLPRDSEHSWIHFI
ncbi:protein phosphatase 1 regulatory subunit 3D [Gastrophryne carolinensis]